MAISTTGRKRPMPTNRTPAPDAVDNIKAPVGEAHGTNSGANRSWAPSGVGGPLSSLAKNIHDTVDDPVLDKVLSSGLGRNDDQNSEQLRKISDEQAVTTTFGMRRQQDPATATKIPPVCGFSSTPPIRTPSGS